MKSKLFAILLVGLLTSQAQAQVVCPAVFEPVCCLSTEMQVYSTKPNQCECERAGIMVFLGDCGLALPSPSPSIVPELDNDDTVEDEDDLDDTIIAASAAPEPVDDSSDEMDIVCPQNFDPVCCSISDEVQETKSNECHCGASFGIVLYDGPCAARPSLLPTGNPLPCTSADPQVCCMLDSNRTVTMKNKCACDDITGTVLYFGECTF